MSVVSKIKLDLMADEVRDIGGLGGDAEFPHQVREAISFASGTSSGQTAFAYSLKDVAVTDTGKAYDLVGTSIQSILDGSTNIDLDELIAVYVKNKGGGSGNDLLAFGGTNAIPLPQTTLPNGAWACVFFGSAGIALTAGSTDTLNLDCATGEDTTADIWLIGR